MFGITYNADGSSISSVSGQSGSIVEGKSYTMLAGVTPNNYIDEISSNGAKIIFQTNGGKGCGSTYEGPDGSYRTLHTSFNFNLVRTEAARDELMKIYMDYLIGTGDQQAPVVSVTAPGSGEELQQGASYAIEWTATDNVGVVSRAIYFTEDDGNTWTLVDSAAGNTGTFDWTVPTATSALCLIKVFAYDAAGNVGNGESAQFIIGGTGIIPNVFDIKPSGTYKVTITNVQGRIISSFSTKNLDLKQIKQSLPSGLHIVHIMTSKEKFSRKLLLAR